MTAEGLASVLVALITTLGTIVVGYVAARSGKVPGMRKVEDAAALRERNELLEAKNATLTERVAERDATILARDATIVDLGRQLAEERESRRFAERDSDAAARRVDDLYAELRREGKLTDRRRNTRDDPQ